MTPATAWDGEVAADGRAALLMAAAAVAVVEAAVAAGRAVGVDADGADAAEVELLVPSAIPRSPELHDCLTYRLNV